MLRILAYHRVAELRDTPALDSRSVSATPEGFAQQMKHLAQFYRVVSMPEVLEAVEKRRPLPTRAVLITFDDAYADFAEIAWPILRKFHLPATMFVPTAFPGRADRAFWSDVLYQAFATTSKTQINLPPLGTFSLLSRDQRRKSLRAVQDHLTITSHVEAMRLVASLCAELGLARVQGGNILRWDKLRQLAREGLTVASHTRTHAIMTKVTPQQMREEIQGSQEDLQREIGVCLPIFCYPNGNHNDVVVSVLQEQGIRLAFTTLVGPNPWPLVDSLRLHRTVIMPRTTPAIFCLRLLRWGMRLDAWRDRRQVEVMTRGLPGYGAHQV